MAALESHESALKADLDSFQKLGKQEKSKLDKEHKLHADSQSTRRLRRKWTR